jgi:hypothetical protein
LSAVKRLPVGVGTSKYWVIFSVAHCHIESWDTVLFNGEIVGSGEMDVIVGSVLGIPFLSTALAVIMGMEALALTSTPATATMLADAFILAVEVLTMGVKGVGQRVL